MEKDSGVLEFCVGSDCENGAEGDSEAEELFNVLMIALETAQFRRHSDSCVSLFTRFDALAIRWYPIIETIIETCSILLRGFFVAGILVIPMTLSHPFHHDGGRHVLFLALFCRGIMPLPPTPR